MQRVDKLLKTLLPIDSVIALFLFLSAVITFIFGDCATQDKYVNNIGFIVLALIFGHIIFIVFYIYFLPFKKQKR